MFCRELLKYFMYNTEVFYSLYSFFQVHFLLLSTVFPRFFHGNDRVSPLSRNCISGPSHRLFVLSFGFRESLQQIIELRTLLSVKSISFQVSSTLTLSDGAFSYNACQLNLVLSATKTRAMTFYYDAG